MKTKLDTFNGSGYEQQGIDFINQLGIKFSAKFKKHGIHFAGEDIKRDIFTCKFSRKGKSFTLSFGQSINDSDGYGGNPPSAYDVLACIQKYDPGSFEDFCSNFGYDDSDSRKAEKIYKGVVIEWNKVEGFFTPEEIEQLQDIS